MFPTVISFLQTTEEVEVVERKGIRHPDTICDALAETFSRNLCQEYQRRFGEILHHNVDKALSCGGRAAAAFGGGSVMAPINLYLAGRAIAEVGGEAIPIKEIAVEGSRAWLKANLHALDPDRHVQIEAMVQAGTPLGAPMQGRVVRVDPAGFVFAWDRRATCPHDGRFRRSAGILGAAGA